jgi:predicted transposase YbfD/YdcC
MPSTSNGPWPIGFARRYVPKPRTLLPWTAKPCEVPERTTSLLPTRRAFRTHHSQETLLQVLVSDKTNEIPVAQALLPCLPLAGRVCTADALHTQKHFFLAVDALGGAALLTVKANQPTLYADLATYFADPHARFEHTSTRDEQRGRIVRAQYQSQSGDERVSDGLAWRGGSWLS